MSNETASLLSSFSSSTLYSTSPQKIPNTFRVDNVYKKTAFEMFTCLGVSEFYLSFCTTNHYKITGITRPYDLNMFDIISKLHSNKILVHQDRTSLPNDNYSFIHSFIYTRLSAPSQVDSNCRLP